MERIPSFLSAGEDICVPDGIVEGFNSYRGQKVEMDYASASSRKAVKRGGVVLGPYVSRQKFCEVPEFETRGEFYFTLVLRTLETVRHPKIIPLSDMYKYN